MEGGNKDRVDMGPGGGGGGDVGDGKEKLHDAKRGRIFLLFIKQHF